MKEPKLVPIIAWGIAVIAIFLAGLAWGFADFFGALGAVSVGFFLLVIFSGRMAKHRDESAVWLFVAINVVLLISNLWVHDKPYNDLTSWLFILNLGLLVVRLRFRL